MLVKGKDVIGLNVVTIDTGTVIETVKDVAYNPTTQRIEALFVSNGGLFKQARAIHIDAVHNIGEDAAIVADATVVMPIKQLPEVIASISGSGKYLVNTKVLTIEGKALGRVSDVYFDSETGYVDSMEVSQGGIKTLTEGKKSIKPVDIVTIGADTTIVSAYTELKLEAQGEQGGLKGAVNDAKDKASEITTNAKEATQELSDRAVEAGKGIGETVKRRSNELSDAASDAYDDAKVAVDRETRKAKRSMNQLTEKAGDIAEDVEKNTRKEINSLHRDSRKVVAESKKAVQDQTEQVEIKETKIIRKK